MNGQEVPHAVVWDVPGTNHRIIEHLDSGQMMYAFEHAYDRPQLFPGPWYREGGDIPAWVMRGGRR